MTITDRPTNSTTMLGGAITLPERSCLHGDVRRVETWIGEPGTVGTVAVVGAGKMGLPLAAQFASHGWNVTAVDVDDRVVESINAGRSHLPAEPQLPELVAEAHAAGRLRATTDGVVASAEADVIVVIVPVMLDGGLQPDYRFMDAAVATVSSGVRAGATVIIETTLPVGDTRDRYAERLAAASGLELDRDLFVAFSPERLYTGAVIRNLATYPKLVGGIGPNSTDRAAAFYASVLDAEVVRMSSAEAAELSKLADTTYRDINIAFANELAAYAGRVGVDVQEVIQAANSQPYSHIHQPGLGVGGHCIPVYPRFLLARSPEMELVELSRRINDGQVAVAVEILTAEFPDIRDLPVLVLGLTYREGVKELAYSRGVELVNRLSAEHARVTAWDPLLSDAEVEACGARPWTWGTPSDARAIVVQTADPIFRQLEIGWFPQLELLLDGRNSLRDVHYPPGLRVLGFGVPPRGGRRSVGSS